MCGDQESDFMDACVQEDYIQERIEKETKNLLKQNKKLLKACKKLTKFADEVLPQAGKLCIDIGNLNEGLILSRQAIKESEK